MPIPRRFDRRPPERDTTRINERIRVPEVRLIDEKGEQVGIVTETEALEYARERDLDLVEISAEAKPPVCRVLDYSKYKYEQEQRRKAARKHQQQVTMREMKLRPKIATHDYETKKGHILRFLKQEQGQGDDHVPRPRDGAPERGEALLRKLADEIAEFGTIEQQPNQEGRNMTMVMAPVRARPAARQKDRRRRATRRDCRAPPQPRRPRPQRSNTASAAAASAARSEPAGSPKQSQSRSRQSSEAPAAEQRAA